MHSSSKYSSWWWTVIDGLGMREKQTLSSENRRQKLGEGVEWDSGKVALLESVSKNISWWRMDWRNWKEWCQWHRKTNTRDEKRRISKVYGKSKRLPWNWRRVARVLDVTTHVENQCYMLRTRASAIFNFQWLNTQALARIRSRFSALSHKIF